MRRIFFTVSSPLAVGLTLAALVVFYTSLAEAQESVDRKVPQRVVSVGGALTEIIYALGAQDVLVGVDTTSSWPEAATELPQVGYQRSLSTEGILSLRPQLIVATADAGPPAVLDQLRDTGVEIDMLPKDYRVEAVYDRVKRIADLLGYQREGEQLIADIERAVTDATAATESTMSRPRVMFLLGFGKGSSMAAGSNTAAAAMIELAGGVNVFGDFEGYKQVNTEAVIEAAPEYVVAVSHGAAPEVDDQLAAVMEVPGLALTPAGANRRIIIVDALHFLGFGPRIGSALDRLVHELHS